MTLGLPVEDISHSGDMQMGPSHFCVSMSIKESVIGYIHVYDQEVINIFYLIEVSLDRDFPNGSCSFWSNPL